MSNTFQKRGTDYPLVERMSTLPSHYFHDAEIYEKELDKIFYGGWLFACRAEQVPETGDYMICPIGKESIIIVRNAQSEIRALFNVCRHRGTRMCMENTGHFESKHIQCPYHAWTYDLDGKLVGAPLLRASEAFDKHEFGLHTAALHVWEGFVFINLARDPQPFETQMGQLMGRFRDWDMSELKIAHEIVYNLECNWKLIFQNYQECYHCPGVHPFLSELTPYDSAQHDCMEGAVIGGFMDIKRKGGSMTMDGEAAGPPVCNVHGEDLQRVYYYTIFPNLLLTPHPDFVLYHHIIPHGPGRITNVCRWLYHPDVIDKPEYAERIQSAVDFWDMTNRQDWAVCEQMQLGTASKRFEGGIYTASEDVLYAMDVEYLRIMKQ